MNIDLQPVAVDRRLLVGNLLKDYNSPGIITVQHHLHAEFLSPTGRPHLVYKLCLLYKPQIHIVEKWQCLFNSMYSKHGQS